MKEIKKLVNKLSNIQKLEIIAVIIISIVFINFVLPTFARFKNRNSIVNVTSWDGTVSSSYRKGDGTKSNPYVISNGNELAFFEYNLRTNDYANTYFEISSDIILNPGIFNVTDAGIFYILDSNEYVVDLNTNEYKTKDGVVAGSFKTLDSLKNFKGTLNGTLHTIHGLYMNKKGNNGLFDSLEGEINNLYVKNALINGGDTSGIIAANSNNATLKNIMVEGNVIGNSEAYNKTVSTNIQNQNFEVTNNITNKTINIQNNIPTKGAIISKTTLTGVLEVDNNNTENLNVKINDNVIQPGVFSIEMGNYISDNFTLTMSSNTTSNITLSELKYNVVYEYSVNAGLVGISNNTKFINTINKANVSSLTISGGITGVAIKGINITNSYNNGNIISNNIAGGLVGNIENANNLMNITNSYNTNDINGTLTGGIVANLSNNTGAMNISYSFTTGSDGYAVGNIENTSLNVDNSYYVFGNSGVNTGEYVGIFVQNNLANLETNSYFKEYLKYSEYIKDSENDVWVYEENELPILFFDDIKNAIATIHSSLYSWNNLSYELDKIGFKNNITFSITNVDDNNPYKSAEFYVSNKILTKDEILAISEWNPYQTIQTITDNGIYVIYARITDQYDNVSYINSDILTLDNVKPLISITTDGFEWTNLKESINNTYVDKTLDLVVSANDDISGIKSIEYYITNEVLKENDLEQLPSTYFKEYDKGISINQLGKYIIYVKVSDYSGNISYANTDRIILDGYEITKLYAGSNKGTYDTTNISRNSQISIDISYNNESEEINNLNHNLVTNFLLPIGTKITLIDFIKNKVYTYKISTSEDIYGYAENNKATYPFTEFNEVGSISKNIKYKEDNYYDLGKVDEDYTITLDFSDATISKNYLDSKIYMELLDNNSNIIRPTLYNTINTFNLYSGENNPLLCISSDYKNETSIELNSNSQTNIQVNSKLVYSQDIIDTSYENDEIELGIKLVDENDSIVTSDNLNNIIVKYKDKEYHAGIDNIFHIKLDGIKDVNDSLQIITYENDNSLKIGNYYFKLFNYISNKLVNNNEITINAKLTREKIKYKYELNVNDDKNNLKILERNNTYKMKYNVDQVSKIDNPKIRVSLYRKNELTATNQDYTLIPLKDYTSDNLDEFINSIYNVNTNEFTININTTNMDINGYKLVFTLYDDTYVVGNVEKYFIVR